MITDKKFEFLKGARVYLCGPVEYSVDLSWRERVTEELSDLGLVFWNPLVKPSWMVDVDGVMQGKVKLDVLSGVPEAKVVNGLIRRWCLHLVSNCDVVILRCSGEPTVGTWEEISLAKYKPVLCWCDEDAVSAWLVDQLDLCIGGSLFFGLGELAGFLRMVNLTGRVSDYVSDYFKWSFISQRGDFPRVDGFNEWVNFPDIVSYLDVLRGR
jgi:hypothetical protein